MRVIQALVFDLDDTLVAERATAEALILEVAGRAAEVHGMPAEALREAVFVEARKLWYDFEGHPYAKQIGISSWEGLWSRCQGPAAGLTPLREYAPRYRVDAWHNALRVCGADDRPLAEFLAKAYYQRRREVHRVYDDVPEALAALDGRYRLGILTNGAPDMQREKLTGAGLAHRFPVVVAGGDIETRKPLPEAYRHVLSLLGATPKQSVMIGNSLESDIKGARGIGMRTIWVSRNGEAEGAEDEADAIIHELTALPSVLKAMEASL
jgi:putative hydrolase of the HAD superfamily